MNITAPLFLISTGIGLMFGVGASVVASIHLSQGKLKAARINVTQAVVVSSLFLAVLWGVVCKTLRDLLAMLVHGRPENFLFVDYPELSESNIWTKITNIPLPTAQPKTKKKPQQPASH